MGFINECIEVYILEVYVSPKGKVCMYQKIFQYIRPCICTLVSKYHIIYSMLDRLVALFHVVLSSSCTLGVDTMTGRLTFLPYVF